MRRSFSEQRRRFDEFFKKNPTFGTRTRQSVVGGDPQAELDAYLAEQLDR